MKEFDTRAVAANKETSGNFDNELPQPLKQALLELEEAPVITREKLAAHKEMYELVDPPEGVVRIPYTAPRAAVNLITQEYIFPLDQASEKSDDPADKKYLHDLAAGMRHMTTEITTADGAYFRGPLEQAKFEIDLLAQRVPDPQKAKALWGMRKMQIAHLLQTYEIDLTGGRIMMNVYNWMVQSVGSSIQNGKPVEFSTWTNDTITGGIFAMEAYRRIYPVADQLINAPLNAQSRQS